MYFLIYRCIAKRIWQELRRIRSNEAQQTPQLNRRQTVKTEDGNEAGLGIICARAGSEAENAAELVHTPAVYVPVHIPPREDPDSERYQRRQRNAPDRFTFVTSGTHAGVKSPNGSASRTRQQKKQKREEKVKDATTAFDETDWPEMDVAEEALETLRTVIEGLRKPNTRKREKLQERWERYEEVKDLVMTCQGMVKKHLDQEGLPEHGRVTAV